MAVKTVQQDSASRVLSSPHIERSDQGLLQTAGTTRTAWRQFNNWYAVSVACFLRDSFFFQIPSVLTGQRLLQQQVEQEFFRDFFDPNKPLDPNFKDQAKIREHFHMYDQKVSVVTPDGKKVIFTTRVIESKDTSPKGTYNLAFALGNIGTNDNNAAGIYPFLASFLDENLDGTNPKIGRFFLISQYSMELVGEGDKSTPYKAETLDVAGYVLAQLLGAIKENYGEIDQLVAHSLGCIVLGAALRDLARNKAFVPHNILFDRGPSSIENTSRNYNGGAVLLYLAEQFGWSVDVAKEVLAFCDSYAEDGTRPHITISGVADDNYFPGRANLALSPEIDQLKTANKVSVVFFKIPAQIFHERAHHGLGAHYLHKNYLVHSSPNNALKDGQSLAGAVVKHSYSRVRDITDVAA